MEDQDAHPRGIHAPHALLPDGWATDVDIRIDGRGVIEAVSTGILDSRLDRAEGPVVPGMPDAHSHAFQRLLVGRTQELTGADDFWSWRTTMWRLAGALEPEDVQAVSAWVYADLAAAGYTTVAEFHYLFHDRDGTPYADPSELPLRMAAAAGEARIGLTLLPVLYRRSGFDGGALEGSTRRFGLSLDAYVELVSRLDAALSPSGIRVGIAPHSLRAVSPEDIAELLAWARGGPDRPVHIHAAEQPAEVEGCLRATGHRPVEWLLTLGGAGSAWTVVHATHTTLTERARLAASGARIALCPTTEADLGDGPFRLAEYLLSNGSFAIGSDSNAHVSPASELRLLAWSARLAAGRRGALPLAAERPVGAQLWEHAACAGAGALGLPVGRIGPGFRADLVVLDPGRPWAEGLSPDRLLDAFVLSGGPSDIARTVVAGQTVARSGRHVDAERIERSARDAVRRVAGRLVQ
jgi:formimidoylglutamate deiminase